MEKVDIANIAKNNFNTIKKKYGENFAKLCRSSFPSLMDVDNVLINLLENTFPPSKFLYDDLVKQRKVDKFVAHILYKYTESLQPSQQVDTNKTPKEIFEELGYDFYKCETYKDVLSFKKYYAIGEEICTFRDPERIDRNDIFFIVKKDIENYNRDDYNFGTENDPNKKNPQREDEYSTSVLCIQFGKNNNGQINIISRYNHSVDNPNATFSGNINMMHIGLLKSFERTYGIKYEPEEVNFSLQNYYEVNGAYYKYNALMSSNIYHCPNNMIINKTTNEITKFDSNIVEVIDCFLIDKKNCTIKLCPGIDYHDSFLDTVQNLKKIEIKNIENSTNRLFKLTQEDGNITELVVNNKNQIIKYSNENIKEIGESFLANCFAIEEINIPNVEKVGNYFLTFAEELTDINAPKVKHFGKKCLSWARDLEKVNFPDLESVGDDFLGGNKKLKEIYLPEIKSVGDYFLCYNTDLLKIEMPKLKEMGMCCFSNVANVKEINFPELETMGSLCFEKNMENTILALNKLKKMGNYCFEKSNITTLLMPNIE